ncbi:MAG: glycosyltransferase family 4 protein [Bacteroidetes bacterium]|nr:glycosyltransferase family 4 protein [Bacteroidota bacterium]
MKLLFTSYVSVPEFTNPEKWLQRIAPVTGILTALAQQHEVISVERICFEGELVKDNVQYHFIKLNKKVVYFPWRLHRWIKKQNPDVVLVNGLIFPLQVIQLKWMLGRKIKIAGLHHAEKPAHGLKRIFTRWADRCIDHYFFAASTLGDTWVKEKNIGNSKKIHEVMEASSHFLPGNKQAAKDELKISAKMVFLWVGRLDANKDPRTVVKAFLQHQQQFGETVLYMIFQTEDLLKEIQQIISTIPGANAAVQLVGAVAHEKLQWWYNAADVIISGSHYEGSGIAVCEAMSCGCIPVLTRIASFNAMTGNGTCGFLYEPGNINDLLQALQHLMNADWTAEREKVLHQFRTQLSFTAIAEKINSVITGR